jgi:branched-chain amino acid transport system substrate-binding protein
MQKSLVVYGAFVIIFFSGIFLLNQSKPNEIIPVGAILCLSGECAEWGNNSLKGLQLATKEINSNGGILGKKVELLVEDSNEAASPANAINSFTHLSQNKNVKLFIGPTWSPAGLSLAPIIAKRKNTIITSPSLGVAEFNETNSAIFNTWPHDAIASKKLANYAFKQGHRRAAVFSSDQAWEQTQGNVFAAEFKRLGGIITTKVEPNQSATDLKAEALEVIGSKPEIIFLSIYGRLGLAARELKKLGYNGPQLAVLVDETRIIDAQGALENCIFARYPDPNEIFIEKFQREFHTAPGITADTAYDTLMLYAKAIKENRSLESQALSKSLLASNYSGASGNIVFDTHGGVKKEPIFYIVKGMITIIHQQS